ncbi:hypothetical protein [Flavobacterium quisquiliarum]|uniref:Phage protein n=1 Tax=Flavobacterium quisquiliarum TaxID=1834436 RepID=A0ABV8W0M0_9FLAO|nr:hypothetical protein [Flavobacterium quisquiliarum]MBW1656101.1 hypothetical protein [Flavobacterium quisquiliarum]
MKEELIKKEYTQELENLINEKRIKLDRLTGFEKEQATYKHLIEIDEFVILANRRLNEIITVHELVIRSEQQYQDFMHYITPAAEEIYRKYYQGLI